MLWYVLNIAVIQYSLTVCYGPGGPYVKIWCRATIVTLKSNMVRHYCYWYTVDTDHFQDGSSGPYVIHMVQGNHSGGMGRYGVSPP